MKLIDAGITIREAARKTGVPKSSLARWIERGAPARFGKGRFLVELNFEEEEMLVVALEKAGQMGWPVGFEEAKLMVKSYLDDLKRSTSFVDNMPGKDWCIGFKKRWSHRLSLKKPEVLTKKRSENLSKKNLDAFFEMVKMQYESDGLLDDFYAGEDVSMRIFNLDETGCSTNPTGQKLFFSRKSKQAYMLTPTCGKAMYTVLFTGNANGDYLAPFVVYKGKNLYDTWTEGGPHGCKYAVTDSGWMTDIVFENWFKTCFVPAVANTKKPVVVFCDGHGSHLTYNTVVTASSLMRESQ